MRNECLNHKYIYESAHPLNRLIFKVAESKTKNMKIFIIDLKRISRKNPSYE